MHTTSFDFDLLSADSAADEFIAVIASVAH